MNIDRAYNTCGWMPVPDLTYLAEIASKSQTIVEIGSWKGRSTLAFACNTPGTVYAVDTWKGTEQQGTELSQHEEGWLLEEFKLNTAGLDNIVICEGPSVEMAKVYAGPEIDVVFIDGYHTYEGVRDDILSWSPMLRPGGILCGHDYVPPYWEGLLRAVREFVPKFRVVPGTMIWTTDDV